MNDKEKMMKNAGKSQNVIDESHFIKPSAKQQGRMSKLLQPYQVNATKKEEK